MSDKLLNVSQREAVEAIEGPVLVIAGPGSGKTRVIEYRVLNLLHHGIKPESILLLTFTRRAAAEMLNRAAEHDERARKVEGGTFHSFAYKLLKQYGAQVGLPKNLMILDEDDAQEALGKIATKLGFGADEKRFPKKSTLRAIISASSNKNLTIEAILEKEYDHLAQFAGDIEKIRKSYSEYKKENGYLDYDDLLFYAREILKDERLREILSNKYKFVMVDEYQDTNKLQGDITYLLSSKHRNVMVVGDDAQSIYGFRGAYHENIMSFPDQFKDCKVVKLQSNYRSTQAILDLSNAVLDNMPNKFKKVLVAARPHTNNIDVGVEESWGEKPTIMYFGDAEEEAGWVRERVQENILNGIPLAHQAILFRSSYISIQLQAELARAGIPFKVFGGLKFYETAHVKDVLAHLKVLANFKDELSWSRVFTLLPGIGGKTAETIASQIRRASDFNSALDVLGEFGEGYKYSPHLAELKETLMKASGAKISVGEKFGMVVDYYMPILKDKFDEWPNRLQDLEALRQITFSYTELEDLLADLAIEIPDDEQKAPAHRSLGEGGKDSGDEKPLTLSTIHSAKGLEWDVVFLLGVAEGTLPSKMALAKSGEEIEEEHRLFYVAITRARNKLYLLFHLAGDMGPMTFNRLSRFVDDPSVLLSVEHKDLSMMGAKDRADYDDENDGIDGGEEIVDY